MAKGGAALLLALKPKAGKKACDCGECSECKRRGPGHSGMGPGAMDMDTDDDQDDLGGKQLAAEEILEAVKSGDASALADAICSLIDLHKAGGDY